MKTLTKTLRTMGTLSFIICLLILTRKYNVGFLSAFFLLSCPMILVYLQGVAEGYGKSDGK